jgi:UTP--glucose-1-phosphate uridylyltransferase
MDCSYVRQPRSLGLGHAVLCAQPLVGNEPFAVLLADDLMTGEGDGPRRADTDGQRIWSVADIFVSGTGSAGRAHVRRYGIVAGDPVDDRVMRVRQMVEKPAPEAAHRRAWAWRVATS